MIQGQGYAHARRADTVIVRDTAARKARISVNFRPGEVFYIGHVGVSVTTPYKKPALDSNDVRSILQFKTGDRFSPLAISASQRAFYETQLYAGIRMDTVPKLRVVETDSSRLDTLHVNVQLTEQGKEAYKKIELNSLHIMKDIFQDFTDEEVELFIGLISKASKKYEAGE